MGGTMKSGWWQRVMNRTICFRMQKTVVLCGECSSVFSCYHFAFTSWPNFDLMFTLLLWTGILNVLTVQTPWVLSAPRRKTSHGTVIPILWRTTISPTSVSTIVHTGEITLHGWGKTNMRSIIYFPEVQNVVQNSFPQPVTVPMKIPSRSDIIGRVTNQIYPMTRFLNIRSFTITRITQIWIPVPALMGLTIQVNTYILVRICVPVPSKSYRVSSCFLCQTLPSLDGLRGYV